SSPPSVPRRVHHYPWHDSADLGRLLLQHGNHHHGRPGVRHRTHHGCGAGALRLVLPRAFLVLVAPGVVRHTRVAHRFIANAGPMHQQRALALHPTARITLHSLDTTHPHLPITS